MINRHFFNLLIVSLVFGSFLAGSISLMTQPILTMFLLPPEPRIAHAQEPTQTQSPVPPTSTPTNLPTATSTLIPSSTPTPTPPPTTIPLAYAFGPADFPDDVNPLTGLPVENASLLERRPLVIKVTNYPRSVRPQWGLTLADHVYEYYIADYMSRFIGIFYGNDASRVGPVRSARLFDEHIMRMYEGIFVFGWADDPVLEPLLEDDLRSYLLVERPGNCPPLCRIGSEYAYNTLFADTSQIGPYLAERRIDNQRQDQTGLRFELDTPKSGNPGEQIYLQYTSVSYHRWEYDPIKGRYLRFQDAHDDSGKGKSYSPLVDSLTEKQIEADNVIVLFIPHEFFRKSSSTEIIDQPIQGVGSGYAFRDGQLFPLTWSQEASDQLLRLRLPNGEIYPLKPGNVWFEVIGETSNIERPEESTWRFGFQMP
jgi:hypothetical protein